MQEIYASGLREGGIVGEVLDLATPRSPRQILEWWGTEYRRAQDPFYWVDQTLHRITNYISKGCSRPIVIADIYKLGEAALIKAAGGTIWRIERPGHEERTTHTTSNEHLQIQADLTLHNMGDIHHLQHLVLTHWHELQRNGQSTAGDIQPLLENYS